MLEVESLKEIIINNIFAPSREMCLYFKNLKEKVIEIVNGKKMEVEISVTLRQALQELLSERKIYKKRTLKGVVRYCIIRFTIPVPESTIPVKIETTDKIITSPTHSLYLMKLKEDIKTTEGILTIALQELYNEWRIIRVETSEGEYCSLPKYNINSAMTGFKLYNFIKEAEEALTAKKLADKVRLNPSYVFKICRRLEKGGYITEGEPERKRRFLASLTGEVVHKGNYHRVKELNQELGGIVSKFSLKDPRLKQGLQSSLENMLEREDLARFSESIETFKKNLPEKISQAKKKSEVHGLLGIKPFPQFITTWKKLSE